MAAEVEKNRAIAKPHSRGNDIVALVLAGAAVLIFLSLATYSSTDWSLNTASTQKTQNWIGVFGSVVADLLFQTVGLTAYFLPVLLGLIAWRTYRAGALFISSIGRALGYFLFIVSLSGLCALAGFSGGVVGVFLARSLAHILSNIGAMILLFIFLAASVLIITTFSLESVFGSLSLAWSNLKLRFDDWRAKRNARREAINQAAQREQKRSEPKIQKPIAAKPKLSNGANALNKTSLAEKVSALFERFKSKTPKVETAAIEAKAKPTVETEPEEKTAPIISVLEDAAAQTSEPEIKTSLDSLFENADESAPEKITFTPHAETSTLR